MSIFDQFKKVKFPVWSSTASPKKRRKHVLYSYSPKIFSNEKRVPQSRYNTIIHSAQHTHSFRCVDDDKIIIGYVNLSLDLNKRAKKQKSQHFFFIYDYCCCTIPQSVEELDFVVAHPARNVHGNGVRMGHVFTMHFKGDWRVWNE